MKTAADVEKWIETIVVAERDPNFAQHAADLAVAELESGDLPALVKAIVTSAIGTFARPLVFKVSRVTATDADGMPIAAARRDIVVGPDRMVHVLFGCAVAMAEAHVAARAGTSAKR